MARTNQTTTVKYTMRNDMVLIRKQPKGKVRGLHMPAASAEGVDFFVEAFGPEVKNLEIGDQIMLMGSGEEKFYPVPGDTTLLVAQQKLVAYVITEGVAVVGDV